MRPVPETKPETDSSALLALEKLSPREREIIGMVALGLSNQTIGERLFISDKTVKNYLSTVFEKLHVTRRAEAAVLYAQQKK